MGDKDIYPEQAYEGAQTLFDIDAYCDAFISRMWAGVHNWLGSASFMGIVLLRQSRNWVAARRSRGNATGHFHFLASDAEVSIGNDLFPASISPKRTLDLDHANAGALDSPTHQLTNIRLSAVFQRHFADHVNALLVSGGILSPNKSQARWQLLINELRFPLHAEAGAWGSIHPESFL